jgi:hypothetical protein
MSFAYWDNDKLKLGFKAGKKWKYKRVPPQIQAIEKSHPERAFELAKKLANQIDRQQGASVESWGGEEVTLRMFLQRFIANRREVGLASVDDDESRLSNHVLTESVVDMPIRDVRPRHTRPLLIGLNGKVDRKVIAPRTAAHVWSLMHTAFEVAIEEDLATENPFGCERDIRCAHDGATRTRSGGRGHATHRVSFCFSSTISGCLRIAASSASWSSTWVAHDLGRLPPDAGGTTCMRGRSPRSWSRRATARRSNA